MKIYFSGIGGSGLSGIALLMSRRGHMVVGSDRAFESNPSHPVIAPLIASGVRIVAQDGACLDKTFDLAVFSTAVEHARSDYQRSHELGIPTMTRPEYLAQISTEFGTVAVAGTSGKSTTSGMLAYMLHALGKGPSFLGGGRVRNFHTSTNPGNTLAGQGDTLVIEACESDGSIVNYRPRDTILLNLSVDHQGLEATSQMFVALMENTKGAVLVNADDAGLARICPARAVKFSLDAPSPHRALDIALEPMASGFVLHGVRYRLKHPGRHNVSNAVAALSYLIETGAEPASLVQPLYEFNGIERRYEVYLNGPEGIVLDDYAHNPHKISALMETFRNMPGRVIYFFQPHGYGPVRSMKDEYVEAFAGGLRPGDRAVFLPIYYAGGTVQKDVSSALIADALGARGFDALALNGRDELYGYLEPGQCHVLMGARDETLPQVAKSMAQRLHQLHTFRQT